jgi:hypothetical protein
MNARSSMGRLGFGAALSLLLAFSAHAQQASGAPGSPNATTPIDGRRLPPPRQKFGGKIERDAAQSKPYWPPRVVPPKGAPNVLLIMTDDTGFGVSSTFGGVIPTPSLDRVAANGLRFTNFNSTALCSPTRAALITGRNHHSMGFGAVSEQATGYPGYDSLMSREKAMMGDHAVYHDGWMASTKVMRPPWVMAAPVSQDPAGFPYELYDLTKDWTQFEDLAAKHPDKVRELDKLFWAEADKYQVLPLDASLSSRAVAPRPSLAAGRTEFSWAGAITGTPHGNAPFILDSSYVFQAEVEIPQGGAEGMLVTQGGRFSGYGFYVLKGKPVFLWNLYDMERVRWEAPDALPPGRHMLEFEFQYDGLGVGTLAFNDLSGVGRGGTGVLKVDGQEVARGTMARTIPLFLQINETFDIGADTGTPVAEEYQVPFAFTGRLSRLRLTLDRPKLTPEDEQRLREMERNHRMSE